MRSRYAARASRPRRLRSVPVLALLALVAVGCEVDAAVIVDVRDDGSGVVRVRVVADAEAVRATESGGATIEDSVRLADLSDAGWRVGAWRRAEDGSATLVLSKPFSSVDEVAGIMREISGPDGPLQRVRVTRERGLLSTEWSLSGRADLADVQTGVATDPELVASLTNQQVDVDAIDRQLLAQLEASFGLRVEVRLPGGERFVFAPEPGGAEPLQASSSVLDTERVAFLVAALGFALLALVVWRRGGRRRRGGGGRGAGGRRGPPARSGPASRPLHSGARGPSK
jgi:hypothetical protein